MIFCLQAQLLLSSANARDAVRDDVAARIVGKQRFGVDVIYASVTRGGGSPVLNVELRFVTELDRDDLVARIEAFATGPRTPQPGSWYQLHDCTHDIDDAGPCVIESRREW